MLEVDPLLLGSGNSEKGRTAKTSGEQQLKSNSNVKENYGHLWTMISFTVSGCLLTFHVSFLLRFTEATSTKGQKYLRDFRGKIAWYQMIQMTTTVCIDPKPKNAIWDTVVKLFFNDQRQKPFCLLIQGGDDGWPCLHLDQWNVIWSSANWVV